VGDSRSSGPGAVDQRRDSAKGVDERGPELLSHMY